MKSPTHGIPPLSPVLVAGIAISPLPPALLQPVLDAAMAILSRRHPELFTRLQGLAGSTILIDPVDLPFDFLLRPGSSLRLVAVTKGTNENEPVAAIHGPLLTLIQLLEGKLDGDALFFSRDLIVEGDTEAVVTLRNAVDGAGIDFLKDMLWVFGPLAPPARLIAGVRAVFTRLDNDLALLRRALLAPVIDRCEAQAAELRELKAMIAELRRQRVTETKGG